MLVYFGLSATTSQPPATPEFAKIMRLRVFFCSCVTIVLAGCGSRQPPAREPSTPPAATAEPVSLGAQKIDAKHLPNAYRLHPRVISGGLPEGDEAFAELQSLGIKTIISVDGARPDVERANKYGMRYVHLPHGYDGVPVARGHELAKAVRDLPGPVYIHCHHGKHRSPAASTVVCVSLGYLAPESANGVLQTTGTSPNYRGLYHSAEAARRLDKALLDALPATFPEAVEPLPMAAAMIEIEHAHDKLKKMAQNNWMPAASSEMNPAHEALLLREQFTELLRTDEAARQPAAFNELLRESEQLSEKLEAALLASSEAREAANELFAKVTAKCTNCHQQFRDVPLDEKPAAR